MAKRTGQCMCGVVAYAADTADTFAVCHCKMCQQWSSGVFMGVPTTTFAVTKGAAHLKIARTSDWADRAFCDPVSYTHLTLPTKA